MLLICCCAAALQASPRLKSRGTEDLRYFDVVSSAVWVQGEQAIGWLHAYMQELVVEHMIKPLYVSE
jgi:hypothetical protein